MSDQTSTKTQSDDVDLILCRSQLYGALAYFYRHPASLRTDSIDKEQREMWEESVSQLRFSNKPYLQSIMKSLMRELDKINKQEWVSLYEDCFSHTAHGTVSSYELEYGEEHTYRQPQQLGDIAAFYQAFGLKVNEKTHERVDHISVECEFMHFLNFKEAYALEHDSKDNAETCRLANSRFLSEHLGRWAPSFAMRLSKYVKEGLFKHLADFTYSFLIEDCKSKGITPGSSDLPLRSVNENYDSGCVTCSLKPGFQSS
ncbi:MAG: molecular chaperone TorD family protein [Candidatus Omnitrophica bacterium]|nr:molecular chaperone TorD family protein [Candidatus Omnitrophota bacterium]MCA9407095.1 molecular chaperone TorD family protein [Candidatus Omnitrophota bacterium]